MNKNILTVSLFFIVSVGLLSAHKFDVFVSGDVFFQRGLANFKSSTHDDTYDTFEFEKAIHEFEKAVEKGYKEREVFGYLSRSYIINQDNENLERVCSLGIMYFSKDIEFYYRRGHSRRMLKKYQESSLDYDKAILLGTAKKYEYLNEIIYERGSVRFMIGDKVGAEQDRLAAQKITDYERNYKYFLQKYAHYIEPIAETYAYCLLKNHFHLLIRTRSESEIRDNYKIELLNPNTIRVENTKKPISWIMSNGFASLFKSYAQSINKGYSRTGWLFEEPFRRILVDTNEYFTELVYYIHHNPPKHKFTSDFKNYQHSSYYSLLNSSSTKLKREELLEWFGGKEEFKKFHEQYQSLDNLDKFDIEYD